MAASLKKLAFAAIALTICAACQTKKDLSVKSPDGRISVHLVSLDSGTFKYKISVDGKDVINPSALGLVRDDADFSKNLSVEKVSNEEKVSDKYELLHGKKSTATYEANRQVVSFVNSDARRMEVIFQVSNDGVAFRYRFPDKDSETRKILTELTSFNFIDNTVAFIQTRAKAKTGWNQTNPSYEENYETDVAVSSLGKSETGWVFPALFKHDENWVLLTESAPDRDYCASRLLKGDDANELKIGFPEPVESFPGGPVFPESTLPWKTPWRIITVGSLATIVESTLGTDLAKPSVIADASFVKPGRSSWSWVALKDDSTVYDVQRKFIDYASEMKWEYCLIDADWNVRIGYDKMKELIDYGRTKNVGILLWYNSSGSWNTVPYQPKDRLITAESREEEFSRLASMGAKGIKVDFFGGDGQSMIAYYQDIFEAAAKHGLMVNCHGSTLPRGWQRTYPNMVTMEAVKGLEFITFTKENADNQPKHCTVLPFTRNVFDPMDFTPVTFTGIPPENRKTSNTFELALAVLFHSGIQHYGETPTGMKAVPAYVRQAMSDIPVSWDETKFVDGYPGKDVVLARRTGKTWYVAGINGEAEAKTLNLDLSFIEGSSASLITDGDTPKSFVQKDLSLTKGEPVKVEMQPNGGVVIIVNSR